MLFYIIKPKVIGKEIMQICTKKKSRRRKEDKPLETEKVLAHWNKLRIKVTKNWDNKLTVEEELNAQRKH